MFRTAMNSDVITQINEHEISQWQFHYKLGPLETLYQFGTGYWLGFIHCIQHAIMFALSQVSVEVVKFQIMMAIVISRTL